MVGLRLTYAEHFDCHENAWLFHVHRLKAKTLTNTASLTSQAPLFIPGKGVSERGRKPLLKNLGTSRQMMFE
jgi:hypothetical protein